MRIAHFDCFSGISGDMTLSALVSAGVDSRAIVEAVDSLGLGVRMEFVPVRKGGLAATSLNLQAEDERTERHLSDVLEIIEGSTVGPRPKALARRIFQRLAEAEAAVHGLSIEQVHFHEVGALDSIADVFGAAVGLDLLGAEQFTSRSVPTGHGMVKTAHGWMPIPTPATAELLKGVPLAASAVQGELTTPTGAAILTSVVMQWIEQPAMRIERIGYGAGTRDLLEQANVLRLFVGTSADSAVRDQVWLVETNLDDVPGEIIGYCFDLLFAAGALDVFTQPIQMKKNRPGLQLSVMVPEAKLGEIETILFRETATFGIRRHAVERSKLDRRIVTVQTPWGPVDGKVGLRGGGEAAFSPEYEACARVARVHGVPLREVYDAVRRAYAGGGESRGKAVLNRSAADRQ